ncbi:MAG TPA: protein kinase [Pirellulales bacterium]|nr:protein kinase [Pirellulales bacterium]
MNDRPSETLIDLLARLRLATAGQLLSQAPQVRRLAGDLPPLDMIWVDTLVQARLITPFQAAEINAGRGAQLAVGPYILVRPLETLGFADCFAARHLESATDACVYLLGRAHRDVKILLAELERLIACSARAKIAGLVPLEQTGADRGRLWAASALETDSPRRAATSYSRSSYSHSPWRPVRSAAQWMIDGGRFPPLIVLHLAQRMTATLADAEAIGLVHGDLRASSLMLPETRDAFLTHAGLRAIVRPAEGYALADLTPEAFETLAPERVATGSGPTIASDIYACGCLWWHLLAGRSPLAGGNSLGRLQAAHAARIPDIRRLAPETPEPLWRAIAACVEREPNARPASFVEIGRLLGPRTRRGAAGLAGCLEQRKRVRSVLGSQPPAPRKRELLSTTQLAVAVIVLALVSTFAWRRGDWLRRPSPAAVAGSHGPVDAERRSSDSSANPIAAGARAVEPKRKLVGQAERAHAVGQTAPRAATANAAPGESPVAYWAVDAVPPLVLPADRPIPLDRITFKAGQTVRSLPGRRARVVTSGRAAVLAAEDVSFEEIDFVFDAASPGGAVLTVAAGRVSFRRCTFSLLQGADSDAATTAVAWRGPARSTRAAADWQGRLALDGCVIRGFATAIQCPASQRATLELTNSLFAGCGSVARLARSPRSDEACEVCLMHVTARETGPLVRIDYEELPPAVGQLTIMAQESTLAPKAGEPLVLFAGPGTPEPLVAAMEWQGQGSLVTPETAIAACRFGNAPLELIADDDLAVAGLVRSQVGFAGTSLTATADSRTVRWQAALQSSEPPGIDDHVP